MSFLAPGRSRSLGLSLVGVWVGVARAAVGIWIVLKEDQDRSASRGDQSKLLTRRRPDRW